MDFEFSTAGRVLVGGGRLKELPSILAGWGQRFLVVTGRSAARVRPLAELLEAAGLEPRLLSVSGEPTLGTVVRGCQLATEQRVDGVVAFGGGSALDAGKAIAGLAPNPGEILDYLEVIGQGRPLVKPGLPLVAVPTTAGTGTEVTRNAVLASTEHGVKVSLRSPLLMARVALVDPELTYALPPGPTAASGLDALTQLIEPWVSGRANPMTDALCREGILRVARSFGPAYEVAGRLAAGPDLRLNEAEEGARADMAVAALFSGMALANAGLGAVHGFAGPIGGRFPAPHGQVCAVLLPGVMEANLAALRARAPEHPALGRYGEIASLLTRRADAPPEEGVRWVRGRVEECAIPRLGTYGVGEEDLSGLVAQAKQASSMKGNPIPLTDEELTAILRNAL